MSNQPTAATSSATSSASGLLNSRDQALVDKFSAAISSLRSAPTSAHAQRMWAEVSAHFDRLSQQRKLGLCAHLSADPMKTLTELVSALVGYVHLRHVNAKCGAKFDWLHAVAALHDDGLLAVLRSCATVKTATLMFPEGRTLAAGTLTAMAPLLGPLCDVYSDFMDLCVHSVKQKESMPQSVLNAVQEVMELLLETSNDSSIAAALIKPSEPAALVMRFLYGIKVRSQRSQLFRPKVARALDTLPELSVAHTTELSEEHLSHTVSTPLAQQLNRGGGGELFGSPSALWSASSSAAVERTNPGTVPQPPTGGDCVSTTAPSASGASIPDDSLVDSATASAAAAAAASTQLSGPAAFEQTTYDRIHDIALMIVVNVLKLQRDFSESPSASALITNLCSYISVNVHMCEPESSDAEVVAILHNVVSLLRTLMELLREVDAEANRMIVVEELVKSSVAGASQSAAPDSVLDLVRTLILRIEPNVVADPALLLLLHDFLEIGAPPSQLHGCNASDGNAGGGGTWTDHGAAVGTVNEGLAGGGGGRDHSPPNTVSAHGHPKLHSHLPTFATSVGNTKRAITERVRTLLGTSVDTHLIPPAALMGSSVAHASGSSLPSGSAPNASDIHLATPSAVRESNALLRRGVLSILVHLVRLPHMDLSIRGPALQWIVDHALQHFDERFAALPADVQADPVCFLADIVFPPSTAPHSTSSDTRSTLDTSGDKGDDGTTKDDLSCVEAFLSNEAGCNFLLIALNALQILLLRPQQPPQGLPAVMRRIASLLWLDAVAQRIPRILLESLRVSQAMIHRMPEWPDATVADPARSIAEALEHLLARAARQTLATGAPSDTATTAATLSPPVEGASTSSVASPATSAAAAAASASPQGHALVLPRAIVPTLTTTESTASGVAIRTLCFTELETLVCSLVEYVTQHAPTAAVAKKLSDPLLRGTLLLLPCTARGDGSGVVCRDALAQHLAITCLQYFLQSRLPSVFSSLVEVLREPQYTALLLSQLNRMFEGNDAAAETMREQFLNAGGIGASLAIARELLTEGEDDDDCFALLRRLFALFSAFGDSSSSSCSTALHGLLDSRLGGDDVPTAPSSAASSLRASPSRSQLDAEEMIPEIRALIGLARRELALVAFAQAVLDCAVGNISLSEQDASTQKWASVGPFRLRSPNCAAERVFFLDLVPPLIDQALADGRLEVAESLQKAFDRILDATGQQSVRSETIYRWATANGRTHLLRYLDLPLSVLTDFPFQAPLSDMLSFWCPLLLDAPHRSELRFHTSGGVSVNIEGWPDAGFSMSSWFKFGEVSSSIPLFEIIGVASQPSQQQGPPHSSGPSEATTEAAPAGVAPVPFHVEVVVEGSGESICAYYHVPTDGAKPKRFVFNDSAAMDGFEAGRWLHFSLVVSPARTVTLFFHGRVIGTITTDVMLAPRSKACVHVGMISRPKEQAVYSIGTIQVWFDELTAPQVLSDYCESDPQRLAPKLLSTDVPRELNALAMTASATATVNAAMPMSCRTARFVPHATYRTTRHLYLTNLVAQSGDRVSAEVKEPRISPPRCFVDFHKLFLSRGGLRYIVEWINAASTPEELESAVALFAETVRAVNMNETMRPRPYVLAAYFLKSKGSMATQKCLQSLLRLATVVVSTREKDKPVYVIINRLAMDHLLTDVELIAEWKGDVAVWFVKEMTKWFSVEENRAARRNFEYVLGQRTFERMLHGLVRFAVITSRILKNALVELLRQLILASDYAVEGLSSIMFLVSALIPHAALVESSTFGSRAVVPVESRVMLHHVPISAANFLCYKLLGLLLDLLPVPAFQAQLKSLVGVSWFVSVVSHRFAASEVVTSATRLFAEACLINPDILVELQRHLHSVAQALSAQALAGDVLVVLLATALGLQQKLRHAPGTGTSTSTSSSSGGSGSSGGSSGGSRSLKQQLDDVSGAGKFDANAPFAGLFTATLMHHLQRLAVTPVLCRPLPMRVSEAISWRTRRYFSAVRVLGRLLLPVYAKRVERRRKGGPPSSFSAVGPFSGALHSHTPLTLGALNAAGGGLSHLGSSASFRSVRRSSAAVASVPAVPTAATKPSVHASPFGGATPLNPLPAVLMGNDECETPPFRQRSPGNTSLGTGELPDTVVPALAETVAPGAAPAFVTGRDPMEKSREGATSPGHDLGDDTAASEKGPQHRDPVHRRQQTEVYSADAFQFADFPSISLEVPDHHHHHHKPSTERGSPHLSGFPDDLSRSVAEATADELASFGRIRGSHELGKWFGRAMTILRPLLILWLSVQHTRYDRYNNNQKLRRKNPTDYLASIELESTDTTRYLVAKVSKMLQQPSLFAPLALGFLQDDLLAFLALQDNAGAGALSIPSAVWPAPVVSSTAGDAGPSAPTKSGLQSQQLPRGFTTMRLKEVVVGQPGVTDEVSLSAGGHPSPSAGPSASAASSFEFPEAGVGGGAVVPPPATTTTPLLAQQLTLMTESAGSDVVEEDPSTATNQVQQEALATTISRFTRDDFLAESVGAGVLPVVDVGEELASDSEDSVDVGEAVEATSASLRRDSTVEDFSINVLFGDESFDHDMRSDSVGSHTMGSGSGGGQTELVSVPSSPAFSFAAQRIGQDVRVLASQAFHAAVAASVKLPHTTPSLVAWCKEFADSQWILEHYGVTGLLLGQVLASLLGASSSYREDSSRVTLLVVSVVASEILPLTVVSASLPSAASANSATSLSTAADAVPKSIVNQPVGTLGNDAHALLSGDAPGLALGLHRPSFAIQPGSAAAHNNLLGAAVGAAGTGNAAGSSAAAAVVAPTPPAVIQNVVGLITMLCDRIITNLVSYEPFHGFLLDVHRLALFRLWPEANTHAIRSQLVRLAVVLLSRQDCTTASVGNVAELLEAVLRRDWDCGNHLEELLWSAFSLSKAPPIAVQDQAIARVWRAIINAYSGTQRLKRALTGKTITQTTSVVQDFQAACTTAGDAEANLRALMHRRGEDVAFVMTMRPKSKFDDAIRREHHMKNQYAHRLQALGNARRSFRDASDSLATLHEKFWALFGSQVDVSALPALDAANQFWYHFKNVCFVRDSGAAEDNHSSSSGCDAAAAAAAAPAAQSVTEYSSFVQHGALRHYFDSYRNVVPFHLLVQDEELLQDDSGRCTAQTALVVDASTCEEQTGLVFALAPQMTTRCPPLPSGCAAGLLHPDCTVPLTESAMYLLRFLVQPGERIRYMCNAFRVFGIHTTPCVLILTDTMLRLYSSCRISPSGDLYIGLDELPSSSEGGDDDARSSPLLSPNRGRHKVSALAKIASRTRGMTERIQCRVRGVVFGSSTSTDKLKQHGAKLAKSLLAAHQDSKVAKGLTWFFFLNNVTRLHKLQFMHQDCAVLFTMSHDDGPMIAVMDEQQSLNNVARDALFREVVKVVGDRVERIDETFKKERLGAVTANWVDRTCSTYEYLFTINTLASRTRKNWHQYPVFPWVINDYTSETLGGEGGDLSGVVRDFRLPMGAQSETRRAQVQERYELLERERHEEEEQRKEGQSVLDVIAAKIDVEGTAAAEKRKRDLHSVFPFHHGSHYSSSGGVLYYLVRLEPFSTRAKLFQGGSLDHADRLFSSLADAYRSCVEGPTDCKELIPEFYSRSKFLLNLDHLVLGTKQDGTEVGDVALPPWARGSTQVLTAILRYALESDEVSRGIHEWFDLVFGLRQRGKLSVERYNVFQRFTYGEEVRRAMLACETVAACHAIVSEVENFGQTPDQVFGELHPQRRPPMALPGRGGGQSIAPSSATATLGGGGSTTTTDDTAAPEIGASFDGAPLDLDHSAATSNNPSLTRSGAGIRMVTSAAVSESTSTPAVAGYTGSSNVSFVFAGTTSNLSLTAFAALVHNNNSSNTSPEPNLQSATAAPSGAGGPQLHVSIPQALIALSWSLVEDDIARMPQSMAASAEKTLAQHLRYEPTNASLRGAIRCVYRLAEDVLPDSVGTVPLSVLRNFRSELAPEVVSLERSYTGKWVPCYRRCRVIPETKLLLCWHEQEKRLLRYDASTGEFQSMVQFEAPEFGMPRERISAVTICRREILVMVGLSSGVIYCLMPDAVRTWVVLGSTLCAHTHEVSALHHSERLSRMISATSHPNDFPMVWRTQRLFLAPLHRLPMQRLFPEGDRVVVGISMCAREGTVVVATKRHIGAFDSEGEPWGAAGRLPSAADPDALTTTQHKDITAILLFQTVDWCDGRIILLSGHADGSIGLWIMRRLPPSAVAHNKIVEISFVRALWNVASTIGSGSGVAAAPSREGAAPASAAKPVCSPVTALRQPVEGVSKFIAGFQSGEVREYVFEFVPPAVSKE